MVEGSLRKSADFDPNADWAKIGELLVISQLISQENLDSALSLATKMRMPLGRILTMHGYMSDELLMTAAEVQVLIKNNELTRDAAIRALIAVGQEGQHLTDVLKKSHQNLSIHQPLGEALRTIGAITPKQLRTSISASLETGLPVGWVLASQAYITESLLSSAISAQRMIQKELLPQDQVMNNLRVARLQQKDFRKVLSEQNINTQALDSELLLSHLLIKSGAALKTEVLAAREFAMLHNADLEQFLFDFGILSEIPFTAAKAVFSKVSSGELSVDQGVETLQKLKRVDWDMARIDSYPVSKDRVEVTELIEMTGLLTKEQLSSALEQSQKEPQQLSKVLVEGGFLEQVVMDALEKCKTFINANSLHIHKALALVSYCADNQCSLEEATLQFGWTPAQS
jgi:hypothetical protein